MRSSLTSVLLEGTPSRREELHEKICNIAWGGVFGNQLLLWEMSSFSDGGRIGQRENGTVSWAPIICPLCFLLSKPVWSCSHFADEKPETERGWLTHITQLVCSWARIKVLLFWHYSDSLNNIPYCHIGPKIQVSWLYVHLSAILESSVYKYCSF